MIPTDLDRRTFLAAVVAAFGGARVAEGQAQQTGKVARVGRVHPGSLASPRDQAGIEVFRAAMRDLGWIEGRNLIIEQRWAEGDLRRLRALAEELVQRRVDVLVAAGASGIVAAQQATVTIPIVMAASSDPVRSGFVRNLARPEANTTGLSLESQDLHGKRLELLREAVSGLRKVAILSNPSHPSHDHFIRESEAAARVLRIETLVLEAGEPASVEPAVRAAARAKVDALLVLTDPLVLDLAGPRISAMALRHRMATLYAWRELAERGGLLSYGADLGAMHRRSAFYVDRLLKGASPADLPVEQPTKFEFVINLKTARALGLTIPPVLLARADHVIE
jgi:putative ABC transport system substrate-binding protein